MERNEIGPRGPTLRVLLDCRVCPELHRFDDVEFAILIRRLPDGRLVSKAFGHGDYLVSLSLGSGDYPVYKSDGWRADELLAIAQGVEHLAGHAKR